VKRRLKHLLEGRAKSKSKTVFESQSFVSRLSQKENSFLWVGHFFSGGFSRLFFLVHFVSGFQIVGFSNLVLSFQFSFLPLVKVLVNYRL